MHLRITASCTLLLLLSCKTLESQPVRVSYQSTITLSPTTVSSECTLSRTTQNDSLLLATVLTAEPNHPSPRYHTQVWQSQDGGQSWNNLKYPRLPQAADPWGVLWEHGTALIADISEGNRFHLCTSHYESATNQWADPISFGYGFDHCMLLKGLATESVFLIATQKYQDRQGQFQNRLLIGHSKDGGRSFPKKYWHELIHGLEFNAKQAYFHPNGTLMIPITIRGYFLQKKESPLPLEQMQSWLYPFYDHGARLGTPAFMTHLSGRKHHWLIANPQNPENLFFAFTDINQRKLGLIQSENGGATWTIPTWVFQDSSSAKSVDLSAMAMNSRQDLAISWTKKTGGNCYRRMITLLSHENRQLVNQEIGPITCPDESNGWVGRAWPQGGDYCGLSANPDDSFHLLYTHPKQGRFTPHFTQITITP